MIRLGTLLWLAFVSLLGFAMFEVKYEVMDIEDQLAKTNRAILADRDAIHVLQAEWSYLSQPSRLADLAKRHLNLAPLQTKQLGRVEEIPLRPGANPTAVAAAPAPPITSAAPVPPPAPSTPQGADGTKMANAKMRTVP
jgi:cell division protein FtsL